MAGWFIELLTHGGELIFGLAVVALIMLCILGFIVSLGYTVVIKKEGDLQDEASPTEAQGKRL